MKGEGDRRPTDDPTGVSLAFLVSRENPDEEGEKEGARRRRGKQSDDAVGLDDCDSYAQADYEERAETRPPDGADDTAP